MRSRLLYVSPIALIKGVTFKWKSLTKEQKHPFDQLAQDDKTRVEREANDVKKGVLSKISSPKFTLPPASEAVNTALELTTDLLSFIHQNQIKFEGDAVNMDLDKL